MAYIIGDDQYPYNHHFFTSYFFEKKNTLPFGKPTYNHVSERCLGSKRKKKRFKRGDAFSLLPSFTVRTVVVAIYTEKLIYIISILLFVLQAPIKKKKLNPYIGKKTEKMEIRKHI